MPHMTRTQQRTSRKRWKDHTPRIKDGKGQYPKHRPAMANTGSRVLSADEISTRNRMREGSARWSKATARMVAVAW